jgi:hypothetical protein
MGLYFYVKCEFEESQEGGDRFLGNPQLIGRAEDCSYPSGVLVLGALERGK